MGQAAVLEEEWASVTGRIIPGCWQGGGVSRAVRAEKEPRRWWEWEEMGWGGMGLLSSGLSWVTAAQLWHWWCIPACKQGRKDYHRNVVQRPSTHNSVYLSFTLQNSFLPPCKADINLNDTKFQLCIIIQLKWLTHKKCFYRVKEKYFWYRVHTTCVVFNWFNQSHWKTAKY